MAENNASRNVRILCADKRGVIPLALPVFDQEMEDAAVNALRHERFVRMFSSLRRNSLVTWGRSLLCRRVLVLTRCRLLCWRLE